MAETTVLAVPIELHDAELHVVFGASHSVSLFHGLFTLGGGSGPTAFSGKVTINTPTDTTTDPVDFAQGRSGAYALLNDGIPTAVSASGRTAPRSSTT
jgi:hypothetical protein